MTDHRCDPVHEGPFFTEDKGWVRCDACKRKITERHVRTAARDYLGISVDKSK